MQQAQSETILKKVTETVTKAKWPSLPLALCHSILPATAPQTSMPKLIMILVPLWLEVSWDAEIWETKKEN